MSETEYTVPTNIAELAAECGFEVVGWDETDAGIRGNNHEFIGTCAEVIAYLRAWSAYDAHVASAAPAPSAQFHHTMLVLRSNVTIDPRNSVQIISRPQVGSFRGTHFGIPSDLAVRFEINDITIGNRTQFPQSGAISGEAFAMRIDRAALLGIKIVKDMARVYVEDDAKAAWGRALTMDTCQTAMDVTVIATNVSDTPQPFEALILGKCLRRF